MAHVKAVVANGQKHQTQPCKVLKMAKNLVNNTIINVDGDVLGTFIIVAEDEISLAATGGIIILLEIGIREHRTHFTIENSAAVGLQSLTDHLGGHASLEILIIIFTSLRGKAEVLTVSLCGLPLLYSNYSKPYHCPLSPSLCSIFSSQTWSCLRTFAFGTLAPYI